MDFPTETAVPEAHQPPAPPADGMTWQWLAWQMRLHRENFIPPPHLRALSLAHVEAKAREEGRAEREAREAKESARRIAEAPKSIERALLDGPRAGSGGKVQALPAQRGWRLRVRYINNLRRCRNFREAAARVGIDESTARRWRAKYPAFAARCEAVVAERYAENRDDLRLRAGQVRTRPHFFRGKQVGEETIHDDRALMFLLKLEDAREARAARAEENRLQRAHEIRLKQMEIEARAEARREAREAQMPSDAEIEAAMAADEAARAAEFGVHASAAHGHDHGGDDSPWSFNGLDGEERDIPPPQVVEVPGVGERTSAPGSRVDRPYDIAEGPRP